MMSDVERSRDHRVRIPEGEVRAHALGRGEPILFLHGVSARADTWLPVARLLADRARAWLPDLLGRGRSDARPDLSYDLEAEVVRAGLIADALAAAESDVHMAGRRPRGPRILVGHSQGAAIALALAARRPEVEGLLLSSPVSPWVRRPLVLGALSFRLVRRAAARALAPLHRPFARLVLARASGPHYRAPADRIDAYASPYADARRAETLMRVLADWRPAELEGRLPSDRAIRIVTGARDPRIGVDAARRLATALDAPLLVLPDGGHMLPEQRPDVLAGEIAALLDALGPVDRRPGR